MSEVTKESLGTWPLLITMNERWAAPGVHFDRPLGPICPGVFLLDYSVQALQQALGMTGLSLETIKRCEFRGYVPPPAQLALTITRQLTGEQLALYDLSLANAGGELVMRATVGLRPISEIYFDGYERTKPEPAVTNRATVATLLPQGESFQFVDRVTHQAPACLVAQFRLPEEWALRGECGTSPLPDRLLLEAACQAALLRMREHFPEGLVIVGSLKGEFFASNPSFGMADLIRVDVGSARLKGSSGTTTVGIWILNRLLFEGRIMGHVLPVGNPQPAPASAAGARSSE